MKSYHNVNLNNTESMIMSSENDDNVTYKAPNMQKNSQITCSTTLTNARGWKYLLVLVCISFAMVYRVECSQEKTTLIQERINCSNKLRDFPNEENARKFIELSKKDGAP